MLTREERAKLIEKIEAWKEALIDDADGDLLHDGDGPTATPAERELFAFINGELS